MLESFYCDLLDLAPTSAEAKAFAKLKKAEKAKTLEDLFSNETKPEVASRHRSNPKPLLGHMFSTDVLEKPRHQLGLYRRRLGVWGFHSLGFRF